MVVSRSVEETDDSFGEMGGENVVLSTWYLYRVPEYFREEAPNLVPLCSYTS